MMRLHNYLLPLTFVAALVVASPRAHAAQDLKVTFMGDFVSGISIPIADSTYKKFADPAFKLGVRLGAVFYINRRLGVAPEAEFDYIAVNTNDGTYQNNHLDATFNRVRGLVGGRVIIPFGIGSFYTRLGIGVDYLTGSIGVTGINFTTGYSSTAFTLEPGFGVQFNIHKHLVVGATTGFPIAFFSTNNPLILGNSNSFTAVDIDFMAVFGVRL